MKELKNSHGQEMYTTENAQGRNIYVQIENSHGGQIDDTNQSENMQEDKTHVQMENGHGQEIGNMKNLYGQEMHDELQLEKTHGQKMKNTVQSKISHQLEMDNAVQSENLHGQKMDDAVQMDKQNDAYNEMESETPGTVRVAVEN